MREVIAIIFLVLGMLAFIISLFGLYRFRYVLNRMHAAAVGDTLGIGLIIIGLAIMSGGVLTVAKLLLIPLFYWMSSPVATNMIARVEALTNAHYKERMREK